MKRFGRVPGLHLASRCNARARHLLRTFWKGILFHAMKSPDPKQDGSMVAAIERYRSRRQRLSEGLQTRSQSVYRLEGPEVPTSSHVMTNEFQGKELLVYGHVRSEFPPVGVVLHTHVPEMVVSKRKSIFQTTTRWLQWNGSTAWAADISRVIFGGRMLLDYACRRLSKEVVARAFHLMRVHRIRRIALRRSKALAQWLRTKETAVEPSPLFRVSMP